MELELLYSCHVRVFFWFGWYVSNVPGRRAKYGMILPGSQWLATHNGRIVWQPGFPTKKHKHMMSHKYFPRVNDIIPILSIYHSSILFQLSCLYPFNG